MNAEKILQDVLAAMQSAEDLEGPVGDEYINLMERIAFEATVRAALCRDIMGVSQRQSERERLKAWKESLAHQVRATNELPLRMHRAEIVGSVSVGAGTVFHPARKTGSKIEVLCKCAATRDRVGRLPIRFHDGVKPNCANGRLT